MVGLSSHFRLGQGSRIIYSMPTGSDYFNPEPNQYSWGSFTPWLLGHSMEAELHIICQPDHASLGPIPIIIVVAAQQQPQP